MFGLAALPSIGLVIGMAWLPDSPRWLMIENYRSGPHAVGRLRRVGFSGGWLDAMST